MGISSKNGIWKWDFILARGVWNLLFTNLCMCNIYFLQTKYIQTFMPKSSIIFKKSYVLAFSPESKFNLAVKKEQGLHLNNLGSIWESNVTYQVSKSLVKWFWRRILKVVLPNMGVVAMLVMWLKLFKQIFIPLTADSCIQNLDTIGPIAMWIWLKLLRGLQRSLNNFDLLYS